MSNDYFQYNIIGYTPPSDGGGQDFLGFSENYWDYVGRLKFALQIFYGGGEFEVHISKINKVETKIYQKDFVGQCC